METPVTRIQNIETVFSNLKLFLNEKFRLIWYTCYCILNICFVYQYPIKKEKQ